jgi:hypothetical protein
MSRRTFSEDIVFVNKTSKNFSKRSKGEAYQINSHINGSYARWKRKENAIRLRSQATKSTEAGPAPRITDSRRTAVCIQASFGELVRPVLTTELVERGPRGHKARFR